MLLINTFTTCWMLNTFTTCWMLNGKKKCISPHYQSPHLIYHLHYLHYTFYTTITKHMSQYLCGNQYWFGFPDIKSMINSPSVYTVFIIKQMLLYKFWNINDLHDGYVSIPNMAVCSRDWYCTDDESQDKLEAEFWVVSSLTCHRLSLTIY